MPRKTIPPEFEQITFQELAERFKRLEESFAELSREIKAKLKALQT